MAGQAAATPFSWAYKVHMTRSHTHTHTHAHHAHTHTTHTVDDPSPPPQVLLCETHITEPKEAWSIPRWMAWSRRRHVIHAAHAVHPAPVRSSTSPMPVHPHCCADWSWRSSHRQGMDHERRALHRETAPLSLRPQPRPSEPQRCRVLRRAWHEHGPTLWDLRGRSQSPRERSGRRACAELRVPCPSWTPLLGAWRPV